MSERFLKKKPDTAITKMIGEIGKDLQILTCKISNIAFFQTNNYELTESAISQWLNYELGNQIFFNRHEFFVKQVSDSYPLFQLSELFR